MIQSLCFSEYISETRVALRVVYKLVLTGHSYLFDLISGPHRWLPLIYKECAKMNPHCSVLDTLVISKAMLPGALRAGRVTNSTRDEVGLFGKSTLPSSRESKKQRPKQALVSNVSIGGSTSRLPVSQVFISSQMCRCLYHPFFTPSEISPAISSSLST